MLLLIASIAQSSSAPHIVFLLVDDLGYNDVGWRNPLVRTPTLDALARGGVVLERHYVFKYCSPSRTSFLTGRLPHHAHQWNLDSNSPWGANINMTMISSKLKAVGYSTHLIGKWGVGFFSPDYLPTSRGFDTSSGFLGSGEDHFDQRADGAACAVDFWRDQSPDHRNGTYDAWTYKRDVEAVFAPWLERATRTGRSASAPLPPMFLYMAFHNVHSPLQAPAEVVARQDPSLCPTRRTLHAMVEVVDNVTATVVSQLQRAGMYQNSIVAFSADNGGAPGIGSNYPLRGCKSTFFEGGVRAAAFLHSPLLPTASRGRAVTGLMHICDWYATFARLAGADPTDTGPGRFPVDSVDMWPMLTGQSGASGRAELVIGFNFTHSYPLQGAIIVGNHKLIVNKQGYNLNNSLSWTPPDYPCSKRPDGSDCSPYCVFDIYADPSEEHDLAGNATLLAGLVDRYVELGREPVNWHDRAGSKMGGRTPDDPYAATCAYMATHGGYWRPWHNTTTPPPPRPPSPPGLRPS